MFNVTLNDQPHRVYFRYGLTDEPGNAKKTTTVVLASVGEPGEQGRPVLTTVGEATVTCYHRDQDVRNVARKAAMAKLMKDMPREQRTRMWIGYFAKRGGW